MRTVYQVKTSWLTPKAESRVTSDRGRGTFATEAIEKDEVIAVWAGELLTFSQLEQLSGGRRANALQIAEDLYLVPQELADGDYINHCCEPNAGIDSDRVLVAMRGIKAGEEITYDYAMTDTARYDEFECRCGSEHCRGRVSADDWKRAALRERYNGYFSSYIVRKIDSEEDLSKARNST